MADEEAASVTPASWKHPSTWIPFLYATLVYYLSLIGAHLLPPPQRYERITGDKSSGEPRDADDETRQSAKAPVPPAPLREESSSLRLPAAPATVFSSSPPSSFDCNCLTPHLSKEEGTRSAFVSTLSLPRSSLKKRKPTSSAAATASSPSSSLFRPSFPSSTSVSTVSFRSPSPSSSSSSSSSGDSNVTVAASKTKSIIAVVPSGSHVLVGIPKLDWKTDSIRIKRTRMSEWLDAEQRDVMRQFDEVIRNEEETSPSSPRRKGILKNGSVRSTHSSTRSKLETPVFVPPPPPPQENPMEPLPRLAHLEKTRPDEEFGFNLHAERGKGHFIGTVDAGGVGQHAGLEMGQRIVGVNGHLITPATKHPEVVALIKRDKMKTSLLVASPEVDKWHTENHVAYSFDRHETFHDDADHHHQHHQHHEEAPPLPKSNGYEVAPSLNPHSIQVNEEREVSKLTTTTKTEVISTNSSSYQYKETTTSYDAYSTPPANADDLMSAVFAKVELPTVGHQQHVTVHSHELAEDASSISSLTSSSHRESAVDVPVSHQYVPSYVSQSHQEHSQTQTHPHQHHQHHHHHHQQHQQPSPLSNGSSHGYAASSTSGYDDDDIYHLSAKEARERLRMKNRKHHLHEMSLNEKYQLVSNM